MALVIRCCSGIGVPVFSSKLKVVLFVVGVILFVAAVLFAMNRAPGGEVGIVRRLPDGSTLELRAAASDGDPVGCAGQPDHGSSGRVQMDCQMVGRGQEQGLFTRVETQAGIEE